MSDKIKVHHWHVAHGLAGYGPEDHGDRFAYFTDPESLADYVRGELDRDADALIDSADNAAEHGEYEEAWNLRKLADAIGILRQNLDNDRRDSSHYRYDRAAWHETILQLIGEHFPMVVDPPAQKLYVWECSEGYECEHYRPEDHERIQRVIEYLDSQRGETFIIPGKIREILTERADADD